MPQSSMAGGKFRKFTGRKREHCKMDQNQKVKIIFDVINYTTSYKKIKLLYSCHTHLDYSSDEDKYTSFVDSIWNWNVNIIHFIWNLLVEWMHIFPFNHMLLSVAESSIAGQYCMRSCVAMTLSLTEVINIFQNKHTCFQVSFVTL